MKRAVITGATGAIGMALIQLLIQSEVEVLVFCHKGSTRNARIPVHPLVTIGYCDLSDLSQYVDAEKKKYDVFYHFAWAGTSGSARNDMDLQVKNVQYTLDAVRLAKQLGCSRFIGVGSQAEYGRVSEAITPNTPAFPENGYGIAKLCAGQMSRLEAEKAGISHIWVRVSSVYGPYDGENTLIISTIRKLLNEDSPSFTKGEQIWDYLFSSDAAVAFMKIAEQGVDGSVYCLGGGEAKPLKEYILELGSIVNPTVEMRFGEVPYGEKQVMYLSTDISDLSKATGFIPNVSFSEGMKKTLAWVILLPS